MPDDFNERQRRIDILIGTKFMADYWKAAYEAAVDDYRDEVFTTSSMPKGDASQLGDVTVVYNKAVPQKVTQSFRCFDPVALANDPSEDFAEFLAKWVSDRLPDAAEDYFAEVGELLDGCELESTVEPARPKSFKYVRTTVAGEFKEAMTTFMEEGRFFEGLMDAIEGPGDEPLDEVVTKFIEGRRPLLGSGE